ncbi:MAG: class I SAM-dependent methyltransferase [Polyangiaceae bacterium]
MKRVRVFRRWIEDFRSSAASPRLKILDYGCGTGARVTVPLAATGDEVHGVDVHAPSIEAASRANQRSNLSFSVASTSELVARGGSYDVIVCSEVLEHLTEPEVALGHFYELLAPGGELFVTVPNGYGAFENLRRVEKTLDRTGVNRALDNMRWVLSAAKWRAQGKGIPPRPGSRSDGDEGGYLNFESGHVQFFTVGAFERLLRSSGFEWIESRGRTLLCGPYADFLMVHLSLGGRLYALNNKLADDLPLAYSAGWMYRLRKAQRG